MRRGWKNCCPSRSSCPLLAKCEDNIEFIFIFLQEAAPEAQATAREVGRGLQHSCWACRGAMGQQAMGWLLEVSTSPGG